MTAPNACQIGLTYYFGPTFSSGFWNYLGGGFSFPGTTIESPTSGLPEPYAYRHVSNLAGLHVEMAFQVQDNSGTSISSIVNYNGIGICRRGINTAVAPWNQSPTFLPLGSAILRTFSCFSGNMNAAIVGQYASGCILNTNQLYGGIVTLDVGQDLGGNVYNVTVRLRIPDAAIDQTRTYSSTFALDNSGTGTDGYVALYGPITNAAGNIFQVDSLYMIGFDLPGVCIGTNPSQSQLLPMATGKISHARILQEHRSEGGAEIFHNLMKDKTT